ncbi:HlyD family secretion protein [Taibaiella soli]|uniref:AprE-like beta-barrel domain-containing protein n=1 Tax=Taibaiella soli TaxID=1649169 RepID=A0A2W2BK53_9BACT|nr:HlyD family efflux transporter periplasmic adaptor subunit [Taibaiella soli]PZF73836.1 hypothetical protein DN068_05695 [Taibaiella soli]
MPYDQSEIAANQNIGPILEIQTPVYAPEAVDMLERVPSGLMRWGTLSIIFVMGLLLLIAVFVRYPDTLEGVATVTTDPLPIQLKSAANGRITRLFVRDNDLVSKDAVIAEIENNTGFVNIYMLQQKSDSITAAIEQNDLPRLGRISKDNLQSLGEGQTAYNQLLQNISAYLLVKQQHIFAKRVDNIRVQIGQYQKLSNVTTEETVLINEELKQADERFKANEKLFNEKVISRQEYYEEAAKLRQKQLTLEQQRRAKIQNTISISDNSKQLFEMTYNKEEKENTLVLAIQEQLRNLQNFIAGWRRQYLIVAPYSGHVYFERPLQTNELVTANDALFSIVPDKFHYLAYVQLPAAGLGKIRKGQNAHLLLDHFPYNEYGYLEGVVKEVSAIPQSVSSAAQGSTVTYRAYIQLPDSLVSSYHNKIPFSPEMSGTARIITKDRNLLQRLFSFVSKADK